MKQQLHRSLTFWSGILAMAFICWAWATSFDKPMWWSYHAAGLANWPGGVEVERSTSILSDPPFSTGELELPDSIRPQTFPSAGFFRGGARDFMEDIDRFGGHVGLSEPTGTVHDPILVNMMYKVRDDWSIFIPHWMLLATVASPWAALMIWRARRRKRAAA